MTNYANSDEAEIANIGPLAPAGQATWAAIAQLATYVPKDRWAVVGGQMVAIHGALAGVEPPRVTDDGDVVVDVRSNMDDVAAVVDVLLRR